MWRKKNNIVAKQNNTATLKKKFLGLGLMFLLTGSALGHKKLKSDEYVMFLPDIAYQAEDGTVMAGIQGWVYEKEPRRGLTKLLALFLGIDISKLSSVKHQQLYERTQLFRVDSHRGKYLTLKDSHGNIFPLPATSNSGRTSAILQLLPRSTEKIEKIIFKLHDSGTPAAADRANALYASPNGISIVSDIDDTIKESSVGDTKQLLVNTFLEDFIDIKGMSSWYNVMKQNDNVAFHYVSSSPIQLYPALKDFMNETKYPLGTMHLREATRWTEIISGSKASINHKNRAIERILNAYPKRNFILIGDSSENDPLIYTDLMRRYPKQICAIVIRDVTSNKHQRSFEENFSDLEKKHFLITSSVEEMQIFVKELCGI